MAREFGAAPLGLLDMGQIRADQVYIPREADAETAVELDDQAIVSLVVGDYNESVAYLDKQEWFAEWRENDILYQSPLLYNGDDTPRVSRFTVNDHANTMSDAVKSGLFAENPPYFLRQRGKTTEKQLKGWSALLETLTGRMKLQYQGGLAIHSQVSQGTGMAKMGWAKRTRTKLVRRQNAPTATATHPDGSTEQIHTRESDQHNLVPTKVEESFPWVEYRSLGRTIFDPKWATPNDTTYARFVIDIDFPTWTDLQRMAKTPGYEIPDLDELSDWLIRRGEQSAEQGTGIETGLSDSGSPVGHAVDRSAVTSLDPHEWPILMITRTDANRIYAVLSIEGRYVVIQRTHEHGLGRNQHFAFNWRNIDNSGYGMGVSRMVGSDQRLETGVINHAIGLLSYQMNPAILYLLGQGNAPTGDRTVRAGGFYGVNGDDVRKGWAVAQMPEVPAEAWQMIQYAKDSSAQTSGADRTFMQGNLGGPGSSAARSGTGAARIAAKSDARVQTPVENVEIGFIVPLIHLLMDMVKMYMPLSEIREILSNKLGEELATELATADFFDAELEAEVLAGAKLSAKAAMAQQMPYLMQVFQQPQLLDQLHQEGKTVDLQVILDVLFAVSENYKVEDDIIRDMTPSEKQHLQQMTMLTQGGGVKGQADIQREQVRGQNEMNVENLRGQHELAVTVLKEGVKDQLERERERAGGGNPLIRASGLVDRANDERILQGTGPSTLGVNF